MSAITDFILGKKLKIAAGQLEFIELDCSDSETYTHDAVVTEHPVEGGQNITDHVRVLPIKLSIDGFVTNYAASPTFINLDFTRAEDCYTLLRDWQKQAQRLTVTTGLDEYDDLILKSFSVTRDKESGAALPVRLELVEIQVVESQVSNAQPAIKAAVAKKEAAKQAKKEEKRTSRIQAGLNAIKKLVGAK